MWGAFLWAITLALPPSELRDEGSLWVVGALSHHAFWSGAILSHFQGKQVAVLVATGSQRAGLSLRETGRKVWALRELRGPTPQGRAEQRHCLTGLPGYEGNTSVKFAYFFLNIRRFMACRNF